MTDQEAQYFYNELVDMLNAVGMQRVVGELEEEFHSSENFSYEDVDEKLLSKSAYTSQQTLFSIGIESMDAFSPDAVYPPKKRLDMLINAIEHSVVNVVEIEDYVSSFFKGKANMDEIKFYSGRNPEQGFTLRRQEVLSRIVSARALKGLLDDLRSQIH